jgi:hypothetical protein
MSPRIAQSRQANRLRRLREVTWWVILGTAMAPALHAAVVPASGDERRVVQIALVDGLARDQDLARDAGRAPPSRRAPTIALAHGDRIELRWTSNRDMVLHLHGYNLEVRVGPGRDAAMAFVARAAGRFAVETHDPDGRHRAVLYIEIHPK